MSRALPRFSRPAGGWSIGAALTCPSRLEFYRQELLRHQRCLEHQREYFSERAIHGVEHALQRTMARLDTLCRHQDCDEVMSALLKKFDLVTGLSAWDEHARLH
jgi:hypothetical protein